jgi:hypothetical protein
MLQTVLNSDVPDIDKQADAVGVLNPGGFVDYDRTVRDFVENVDRVLNRIRERRVDFKMRPSGIGILHDLWIDPETLPYDPTPPTAAEGFSKRHGWKCNTLPGCGVSIHKLWQFRPELGTDHAERPYKFHVANICAFCGTLLTLQ